MELLNNIKTSLKKITFPGSRNYWEKRYQSGNTSGNGSYNLLAEFKAEVLNNFVNEYNISSVIEFGCGDGNQLLLGNYKKYIGLDVSKTAIKICIKKYLTDRNKSFFIYDSDCFIDNAGILKADLALSLDVVYHLIEDRIFENYMNHLFNSADKYVIIYSSNTDDNNKNILPHVKHRNFTEWINKNKANWNLREKIPNKYPFKGDGLTGSFADFYIFNKV